MGYFRDSKIIVVKVGTSTLTHGTGHLNLRRIEQLTKVLSDMKNWGVKVVLVSSGAVSAGMAKMGFGYIPSTPEEKQAMAAVGQSELMKIYDRFFSDYGHTVAQILMTKEVLSNPRKTRGGRKPLPQTVGNELYPDSKRERLRLYRRAD